MPNGIDAPGNVFPSRWVPMNVFTRLTGSSATGPVSRTPLGTVRAMSGACGANHQPAPSLRGAGMGETLKIGEYLLAVEGLAMIRTCMTEPSAARPRVDEIRAILAGLAGTPDIPMTEYEVPEGYARWAERY